MKYIDNITLSIYIKLLMGNDVCLNGMSFENEQQLERFASTLDSNFRSDTSQMTIEEEESYNDSYQPVIVYNKDLFEVHISCQDNNKLRVFLSEYSQLYYEGELIENDNIHKSFETLNNTLIEITKNIVTNKKRYILTDTKFAPLILARYLENNGFIKDLSISLAPEGEMPYHPMELYEDNEFGDVEKTQYWQDYFICKYVLDMEWYLDKFNRPVSKTVTVKRRTDYPPQQRKLLNIISNQVKESKYRIDSLTLAQKINLSLEDNCLHSAISRLNKCYKEINNTTTTLIKKNKGTGFYEISREFQPDTEN